MISSLSYLSENSKIDRDRITAWLEGVSLHRSSDDLKKIKNAIELIEDAHGKTLLIDGMDRFSALLHTADTINALKLDSETLVSALLSELPQEKKNYNSEVEKKFGDQVLQLINQVAKIREFSSSRLNEEQQNLENYRQLLLDVSNDVRAVLILLAKRLRLMRRLKFVNSDLQRSIAFQTHQIHAPLANLLGIWQIKWELEDLCFRFLRPNDYQGLVRKLDKKRKEREISIDRIVLRLKDLCSLNEVNAEVYGRPKHIFSIWNKMQSKNLSYEMVFDANAARILVNSVTECYQVLSLLHAEWRQIPSEFTDYIAKPKKNGYQSLHTAIYVDQNTPTEIQIRTFTMHEYAERGIASHWRYKENYKKNNDLDRRVDWMRKWLFDQDKKNFMGEDKFINTQFDSKRIFVLTPKGKAINLPKNSTPIDFAYSIHTSIGHRCKGAKVNGKIYPLSKSLSSGDIVEIIIKKNEAPSRDWLNKTDKYVVSSRAKSRIRQWFNRQEFDRFIKVGRDLLDDLAKRNHCDFPDLENLFHNFGFKNTNELLAAIGHGEISGKQIIHQSMQKDFVRNKKINYEKKSKNINAISHEKSSGSVVINGVGNLVTSIAKCCSPLPQDTIIGYITRGRGITVHRHNCHMIKRLDQKNINRLISANWSENQDHSLFAVDLKILVNQRKGLIQDISSVFANLKVNVIRVDSEIDKNIENNNLYASIAIKNVDQLNNLMKKLRQITDVLGVKRQTK